MTDGREPRWMRGTRERRSPTGPGISRTTDRPSTTSWCSWRYWTQTRAAKAATATNSMAARRMKDKGIAVARTTTQEVGMAEHRDAQTMGRLRATSDRAANELRDAQHFL